MWPWWVRSTASIWVCFTPYGKARQICIRRLRSSRTEPPTNLYGFNARGGSNVIPLERFSSKRPSKMARKFQKEIGVIACTRAPGLIVPLARAGAVVVLEPDSDAIVRAAGDIQNPNAFVLPCDEASISAAHAASRSLISRAAVWALDDSNLGEDILVAGDYIGKSAGGVEALTRLKVADTSNEVAMFVTAMALGLAELENSSDLDEAAKLALMERTAWVTAVRMRVLEFSGVDAEHIALAVANALGEWTVTVTVLVGALADSDVAPLIRDAVGQKAQDMGIDEDLDVNIYASHQDLDQVLVGLEGF